MTIRLEHIWKSFGAVEVLKDVDLELPERQFITLVGPSGCGKTTLLRILAGLESATRGVIWHGDTRVSDLAPGKRDVAMVFQSYALYPHMNVRANMAYGLKVRGTPRAEIDARVLEVARISRALKAIARELEVPVIAISQLSRQIEQRGTEPMLSDLRESGALEADADLVMFLWQKDRKDREESVVRLKLAKHRNGPTGDFDLHFQSDLTRFRDLGETHEGV